MKKLIMPLLLLFLIVAGAYGVKLLLPHYLDRQQKATSDAKNIRGHIAIALDNWFGYFYLRSPEFIGDMRRAGFIIDIIDDKADYGARMKRLKNGDFPFAVATVDSYILNAAPKEIDFPGTIVAVIDESRGGDAILANGNKIKSLDDLKGRTDIRIAFTPDSPSHHLAKAAADHFNVPELLPKDDRWVKTNGSEEALKLLLTGKVDIAISWEPDVSRALSANKGIVKILGTEDTEKLIVDILLANRKYAEKNPDVVKLFLTACFKVMKKYRDNPEMLMEHAKKDTSLSKDAINAMLKGIKWANFSDNCEHWFRVDGYNEALFETIESTAKILVSAGDFGKNPIPDNNPYLLIDSTFLEKIFKEGLMGSGFTTPGKAGTGAPVENSLEARFPPLGEAAWEGLKKVGTLKVDPIIFQSGKTELDIFAKEIVDEAAKKLMHYPNYRLIVEGHTAPSRTGDDQRNATLSQERAEAVARYLAITYGVDQNRMRPVGYGGSKPLPLKPGESQNSRAYIAKLSRVEIVLVKDTF